MTGFEKPQCTSVPRVGKIVVQTRQPLIMAVLAGSVQKTARGGRRRRTTRASQQGVGGINLAGEAKEGMLGALVLALAASLVLAALSWSRPGTRAVPIEQAYDQRGAFSYTDETPEGMYDSSRAQAGDPIFRTITNSVDVVFAMN